MESKMYIVNKITTFVTFGIEVLSCLEEKNPEN